MACWGGLRYGLTGANPAGIDSTDGGVHGTTIWTTTSIYRSKGPTFRSPHIEVQEMLELLCGNASFYGG